MDWLLMIMALLSLACIAAVYIPRDWPSPGQSVVILLCSLLATEFAWAWLVLHIFLSALLVICGALDTLLGKVSLCMLVVSSSGLLINLWRAFNAGRVFEEALEAGLGENYRDKLTTQSLDKIEDRFGFQAWCRPFNWQSSGVTLIKDVQYADGGVRRRLDIYTPATIPAEGCPVLLQIHGGGFVLGGKGQQALPLMNYMANKGWICVAPNYRLSPSVGFPSHLEDIKSALGWIRTHGKEYGMDSSFVAVTGGSAGGLLTALMGLTANRKDLQADYPELDLRVQACVPIYGSYDYHHHGNSAVRLQHRFNKHLAFIENYIMHASAAENRDRWDLASAILQVRPDAPPFMIVHGDRDSVLAVEDARAFSVALGDVSERQVVYAELPGAEHIFDMVHSPRTEFTIRAIHRFLEWVRATST